MKSIKLFIKQLELYPLVFAGIALLYTIAYESWLIQIPEIIAGSYIFGKVINNIVISYFAAYIFLLVIVEYPNFKEKKRVFPLLLFRISPIKDFTKRIKSRFFLDINNWDELPYDDQIKQLKQAYTSEFIIKNNNLTYIIDLAQDDLNNIINNEIQSFSEQIKEIRTAINYASQYSKYLNSSLIVAIEKLYLFDFFTLTSGLKTMQELYGDGIVKIDFDMFIVEMHSLIVQFDGIYKDFENELCAYSGASC